MIDFSKIGEPDAFYEFLFSFFKFNHNHLYYRKIDLVNPQNIPSKETPILLVSNHQNGLSDALCILFISKAGKRPVFVARGDMFKKEQMAKILKFLKILPAFRVRDVGKENLGENDAIFELSATLLNKGKLLVMYPEAMHQNGHFLGNFKKGFARTAFRAMEASDFNLNLQILPVANHYEDLHQMQGKMLLHFGEPFTINDFKEIYKTHPEKAQHLLTQKAQEAVRKIMLDINDKEFYRQIDDLRLMFTPLRLKRKGLSRHCLPLSFEHDKKLVHALHNLKINNETEYQTLMTQTISWQNRLKTLNIANDSCAEKSIFKLVLRLLFALILSPLFILAAIPNLLPYFIYHKISNPVKDKVLGTSIRLGLTIMGFAVWGVLYGIIGFILGNIWWALSAIPILIITHILFYNLLNFYKKITSCFKNLIYKITGNKIYKTMLEEKQNLITKLHQLMDFAE